MYETIYHGFLMACMLVTAALIILCLIRAILGPRLTDRVVAVNMIGTMTIVEIAMFALYLRENYLFDVCLIYAMISFLAVVVLTKIYSGVYLEKLARKTRQQQKMEQAERIQEENMTGYHGAEKVLAEEQKGNTQERGDTP